MALERGRVTRSLGIVADEQCLRHNTGWGHPESPERFTVTRQRLADSGILQEALAIPVREAALEEAGLVHDLKYLEIARHEIEYGFSLLSTGDTQVCPQSWLAAAETLGGVLNALDRIMDDSCRHAFCAVRPPGHHATADRGMGFCILNNAAAAAARARSRHGVERVLIVDWDVHHGNGTQDIFYEDESVFYFSTHLEAHYPFTGHIEETGAGKGVGTTLNVPMPLRARGKDVRAVFEERLIPAMDTFKPELIIISAGFDSRLGDPLGGMELLDDDFAALTQLMVGLAEQYAGGRLLSVLEGGYDLDGLANAVEAHVRELA